MQVHLIRARRHRHLGLLPRLVQAAGLECPGLLSHVLTCGMTQTLSTIALHLCLADQCSQVGCLTRPAVAKQRLRAFFRKGVAAPHR